MKSKIEIPRYIQDAVNNAIHTSDIDGHYNPISLCYVAVRAVLEAQAGQSKEAAEREAA